jgi:hypothetical protein
MVTCQPTTALRRLAGGVADNAGIVAPEAVEAESVVVFAGGSAEASEEIVAAREEGRGAVSDCSQ